MTASPAGTGVHFRLVSEPATTRGLAHEAPERSRRPRYLRARDALAKSICDGTYAPGTKLPDTATLSTALRVSLVTAHRALQCLVQEGWLSRHPGRGTFVLGGSDGWASGTIPCVGLVLPSPGTGGDCNQDLLVAGLRRAVECAERAVKLVLHRSDLSDLDREDIHAVICVQPPASLFGAMERLAARRPVVVLGASAHGTPLHCVDASHADAARCAVRHLVSLGHERIVFVNGALSQTASLHRLEGYLGGMAEHGLDIRSSFLLNARTPGDKTPVARLETLLRRKVRPTAVIASHFPTALDILASFRQMSLRAPRDMSILAFDDQRSATLLDPPLTTLDQPLDEMGVRAFARVTRLLSGEMPEPHIELLPVRLMIRESTGPAA